MNESMNYSRKKILPVFIRVEAAAVILLIVMTWLQPFMMKNQYIFDFGSLLGECAQNNILYRAMWLLADMTEPCFVGSVPASVMMIIMAFAAVRLQRKNPAAAGTGMDRNGSSFYVVFYATVAGLIFAQILYGGLFKKGFVLTFAVLLVIQTFVPSYSRSIGTVGTVVLVSAPVTVGICQLFLSKVFMPAGLPLYASVAFGLLIVLPLCGGIIDYGLEHY
ncbi:MAG: hypothetical protein HFG92_12595 [Dorea sp.]|jgi:hypothetical protein|nr:hypothetical protein [Dorea sp.]